MGNVDISGQQLIGVESISPNDLLNTIQSSLEIAVIDVRDAGSFAKGHLLYASSVPLTRIELLIQRRVPNKNTTIILVDGAGELVVEAAQLLARLGYTKLSVLTGGTSAWQQAGYEIFSGENVPSKAFGEVVEVQAQTPHISARELHEKLTAGEKLVVVDGRTPEEFFNFSIPGAHSVPNAELPYRIREIAPDPSTLIVVNCAGRTRSIIGAQTLIDAGVPNPVVSLQDGTMAWLFAGYELDQGRRVSLPEPTQQHLESARRQADVLLKKAQVEVVDAQRIAEFRADTTRNTYFFDIRSEDEYAAGHLPGWRWAAGGQLIQATDEYIATLRSRVVIADWDSVRAATVAAWLVQLGQYEVFVYRPHNPAVLELGQEPVQVLKDPVSAASKWITRNTLSDKLAHEQAVVVDVDRARAFVKRHIRGAYFAVAETLETFVGNLTQSGKQLVITSADGVLADAVARRLNRRGFAAAALLGGNQGWFDAGFLTASGTDNALGGEQALYLHAYDFSDVDVRNQKFQEYLDWEIGLVQQLERKGAENTFSVLGVAAPQVSHGT